jgi:AcrR family transcriptional regulator
VTPARPNTTHRERQRLETRERIFQAAIAEFRRNGMSNSDINSIASAIGIVRGTFYFHFPTKEHVMFELLTRVETSIADELRVALDEVANVTSLLKIVIRHVVDAGDRLGGVLFRDVLSIYFSATRPELSDISQHPVAVHLVEELEKACQRGEINPEANPANIAKFFLLGLYGLLITNRDSPEIRDRILDEYLSSFCRGLVTE